MKKQTILLLGLLAVMSACNNQVKKPIGGDKDSHGCIAATGASWSELKQNCIQVFNEGTRLNPVETKAGETVFSAFVVLNDDQSKAELFLPATKKTTIINKSANDLYANDTYRYDAKEGALYINGIKKFTTNK